MGRLIAIEGLDGSGKDTQSKLLYNDLIAQGKNVNLLSFPNYTSRSSALVQMYLDGEFGNDPDSVNAYAATTFFAVDRFASYEKDWKAIYDDEDSVIIANRYSTSNAIHQLSKLDRDDWDDYLEWLYDFEFKKLGLPEPGLVLYLEVKPEVSLAYVKKRSEETGQRLDIHELDHDYIIHCYKAAIYAADKLGWERIQCCDGDDLLPIDEIQAKIQEKVTMFLDVAD